MKTDVDEQVAHDVVEGVRFSVGTPSTDLRDAVGNLLSCLERHEFSRSFATGPAREELENARALLRAAFAKHLGDTDDYPRRRRIIEIAKDWLTESAACNPAFHAVNFQKTKALLENVSPSFAELSFEEAAALIKPSPQGRVGAQRIASRWSFAVRAFKSAADRTQEGSDEAFKDAVRAGRRSSRAQT